jgi:hypothetical protein
MLHRMKADQNLFICVTPKYTLVIDVTGELSPFVGTTEGMRSLVAQLLSEKDTNDE